MPRAVTEIRSLARSFTRSALKVLVGVMGSKDATPAARVAAANAILDRGWGKATQAFESGSGDALEWKRCQIFTAWHSLTAHPFRHSIGAIGG
jgi:hypothetical protein